MKGLKILGFLVGFSLVLSVSFQLISWAQDPPIINIELVTDLITYEPEDPIKMQVRLKNTSGVAQIVPLGFMAQDFHQMAIFVGPDNKPRRSHWYQLCHERQAFLYNGKWAVLVEIVPPGWERLVQADAHQFYDLNELGPYTAWLSCNLETFSQCVPDPTNPGQCLKDPITHTDALVAYLDQRASASTLHSEKVSFVIVPPPLRSDIEVSVTEQVLEGPNEPMAADVCLYLKSEIISVHGSAYFKVYEDVWSLSHDEDPSTGVEPLDCTSTDPDQGILKAVFENVDQNHLLIVANCPDCPHLGKKWDYRYMGSPVSFYDSNWGTDTPIQKNFMVKPPPGKK